MKILRIAILYLIGCFMGLVGSGMAQKPIPPPDVKVLPSPVPPPPPLIYSAPASGDIKEFRSDADHFKIDFPGKPESTTLDRNGLVMPKYSVYRQGSHSSVVVLEFPFVPASKKDELMALLKKTLEKKGSETHPFKLINERDLEQTGIKGIEMSLEADLQFAKLRFFFVGNKIYQLSVDVTNWHILKDSYPERVKDFEKESTRFFDSFEILK